MDIWVVSSFGLLQIAAIVIWKLGLPLRGCQAKRHNQAKEWEKEDFITYSK